MLQSPRYRPDIEGLRAIAVLPVLAFHVGFTAVPGGFVGVDIFFVISGYLITQLLQRDIEGNRFSLAGFYERRIRRIGPALVAMLLATFALGLYFDLPDDLRVLGKSVLAAAASVSNFFFWQQSGYFEGVATENPLLHTWSLAVEEQFYLLWPLYLYAVQRYAKMQLLPATVVMTALSLAGSAWGAFTHPVATFYLPFTRLWELSAGGLLALGIVPACNSRVAREAMGACGLALIVGSVFLIHSSMSFPGLLAIPPCLGAMLVIQAGRDSPPLANRLLSIPLITSIGAVSYSLYLWHWPLTIFQRSDALLVTAMKPAYTKLVILAASAALACLSYRFIEQPFRRRTFGSTRSTLMRWAAASVLIMLAVGLTPIYADGLPGRFSTQELAVVKHLNQLEPGSWRPNRCFLYDDKGFPIAPECVQIDPTRRNYLMLGDSHAAHLYPGFSRTFKSVHFLQVSASNCFPTLTHAFGESDECAQIMEHALRGLNGDRRIDGVILLAKWRSSNLPQLVETLDWLKSIGVPVTVAGPTAVYDAQVPRLVLSSLRHSDPLLIRRHLDGTVFALDEQMKELAGEHGAAYLSLLAMECMSAPCMNNGAVEWPELFDQEHFNTAGSLQIAARIKSLYPQFEQSLLLTGRR